MHGEVMVNYWLMKSELDVYPWSQLVEDKTTHWDGVRNYQARNIMRDDMKNRRLGFVLSFKLQTPTCRWS